MKTLLLVLSMIAAGQPAHAAEKPNVVMVFIDDMGWSDLSCFGNTEAATPHIDRMAKEGLSFNQFYVNSPICSPSRVALSTGQYPQRWKITSYLAERVNNEKRGMAQWLDPKAPMLAKMLKSNGYATGHFGKWHMGGQRDVGEAPLITEYGFDESLTNFEGLGPRLLGLCYGPGGKLVARHGLGSQNLGHGPIHWHDRSVLTEGYTTAALDFVKKAAAKKQPFYLNLWPDDVHSPFFPPQDKRRKGGKRRHYLSVLEAMDAQLGVLFDHIRSDEKLRKNTIVLICSDNGPEPKAGSAKPLRGVKGGLYEGGIRSPLIVWAPGLLNIDAAGTRNQKSVLAAIDLTPSLLAITKTEAPANYQPDGVDLSSTIMGKEQGLRKKAIFWRRPPDRKMDLATKKPLSDLAMREGRWKLLCDYEGGRPQLYDIEKDPEESENLATKKPDLVIRLSKAAVAWSESMPGDAGTD